MRQINEIDAFKFAWQQHNWAEQYHLPQATIFDYVEPQNVVITEPTDNPMIEKFIRFMGPGVKDSKSISNYIDLLEKIYTDYQNIKLTENTIKQIHTKIFTDTKMRKHYIGQYTTDEIYVTATNVHNREKYPVFHAASPENTPHLMSNLVALVNRHLNDGILHPLIVIGLFASYFLAIHPFKDGNGRVIRALIVLLLLQTGYTYAAYTSFEAIMKNSSSAHYRAVLQTQQTIWDSQPNFTPWLSFFIAVLYKQKHHLENIINQNRVVLKYDSY